MKNAFFAGTVLSFMLVIPPAVGKQPSSGAPAKTSRSPFVFSLLPKSMQREPKVDCNVITEVMPAGKKLRPPTAEKPAYYFLQAGRYQSLGEAAPANLKPPAIAVLNAAMKKSLAAAHYHEASPPDSQPTLLIVFTYGDHSATAAEVEQVQAAAADALERERAADEEFRMRTAPGAVQPDDDDAMAPAPASSPAPFEAEDGSSAERLVGYVLDDARKYKELLDRAALVGGTAFAAQLGRVLEAERKHRTISGASERDWKRRAQEAERERIRTEAATGRSAEATQISGPAIIMSGPFGAFYNRNPKMMHLLEDAFGSCYFVVASVYDGAAVANGERKLLWRTKMTVNSVGVNMTDTLPTLIATAAPYFGQAMKEVAVVETKVVPLGRVEIGEGTVVEGDAGGTEDKNPTTPKRKK